MLCLERHKIMVLEKSWDRFSRLYKVTTSRQTSSMASRQMQRNTLLEREDVHHLKRSHQSKWIGNQILRHRCWAVKFIPLIRQIQFSTANNNSFPKMETPSARESPTTCQAHFRFPRWRKKPKCPRKIHASSKRDWMFWKHCPVTDVFDWMR